MSKAIQWVECPRDAMQGIHAFIPTALKIDYLKSLLSCGFHTIDAGSFVSAAAIPQLADTVDVMDALVNNLHGTHLLAIVANVKGAERASVYRRNIKYIGYPLSLSETFQQRNTNRSIAQAFSDLTEIIKITAASNQKLVVYLSMGFGNPYGDPYDSSYLAAFSEKLVALGVAIISLSDTVAVAQPMQVQQAFSLLHKSFQEVTFGAHLHVQKGNEDDLIIAALDGGCNRFDTAMMGFGGCPMAKHDLSGNLSSEVLLRNLDKGNYKHNINVAAFEEAMLKAQALFSKYE
jgi:hydroxymethylglutaryl-CoA lyase